MEVTNLKSIVQQKVGNFIEFVGTYVKSSAFPLTKANGAASAGPPIKTDVITDTLATGTGLVITNAFLDDVDDVGSDFLLWQVYQNGVPLNGYDNLGGSIGRMKQFVPLNAIIFPSSAFSVSLLNYSGTESSPSNYPARQDVRVSAFIQGLLFRNQFGGLDQ